MVETDQWCVLHALLFLAGCSEVCMFESGDSEDKMASTPSEPEQVCAVLYLYIYAYVKICLVQFCT